MTTPHDIDNSDLIGILRRRSEGEREDDALVDALRSSVLLVPTAEAIAGDDPAASEGQGGDSAAEEARTVTVLENEKGQSALPCFTHEGSLREWRPEGGPYLGVDAREIFMLAREEGIDAVLVDPASSQGIQIGRDGIEAMAAQ